MAHNLLPTADWLRAKERESASVGCGVTAATQAASIMLGVALVVLVILITDELGPGELISGAHTSEDFVHATDTGGRRALLSTKSVLAVLDSNGGVKSTVVVKGSWHRKRVRKGHSASVNEEHALIPGSDGQPVPQEGQPGTKTGRPVQNIHIAKCGGSTVNTYLAENAQRVGLHLFIDNGSDDGATYHYEGPKHGVFGGHRPRGFAKGLWGKDVHPLYITVLREPVSRYISWHDFVMGLDMKYWNLTGSFIENYQIRHANKSLDQVLQETESKLETKDYYDPDVMFFLNTVYQPVDFLCGVDCPYEDTEASHRSLTFALGDKNSIQIANLAEEHLKSIDVVGVEEQLDNVLLQMKCAIPWLDQSTNHFSHVNSFAVEHPNKRHSVLNARSVAFLRRSTFFQFHLHQLAQNISAEKAQRIRDVGRC